MNILYYIEPESPRGGVSNVAYYLPKALAKKVNVTYFPRFTPKKSYPVNLLNVYRKFVMKEYDIIHFNVPPIWTNCSYMLFKFAKRRDTRTVLNIHDVTQLEHEAFDRPISSREMWQLINNLAFYNMVDRIVVNSKYMRTNAVIWYGIKRDKIEVIPNGVDLMRFTGHDDKLGFDGDPNILYLGLLSRRKGIDVLIQAVAKLRSELPNMKLHLVGDGHMSDFQLLAKKKGIQERVVFHGWIPDSMVPRYYKSADICVFPSRHEPFGIVILEAMASGIPIIASNVGGFLESISNGKNGILFKSEDADALAKAILFLYQDVSLRKKISHNALKTLIEYDWDNIAEKYVSLYRCLCSARSNK